MSPESFSELHSVNYARLVRCINRRARNIDLAEDIACIAFSRAWEKRATFKSRSSFFTWIYIIALNELRHYFRRRKPDESLDSDAVSESELRVNDATEERIDRSGQLHRLSNALAKLAAPQRRALEAQFVLEIPIKQIARAENTPIGTILSRLHGAKRRLRRAWEDVGL